MRCRVEPSSMFSGASLNTNPRKQTVTSTEQSHFVSLMATNTGVRVYFDRTTSTHAQSEPRSSFLFVKAAAPWHTTGHLLTIGACRSSHGASATGAAQTMGVCRDVPALFLEGDSKFSPSTLAGSGQGLDMRLKLRTLLEFYWRFTGILSQSS